MLSHMTEDLKYGLRRIYKNLKLSSVVILSLAIGIGANCAVFSLAEAILFKSLPVSHPEELLIVHWASQDTPAREIATSMSGRVDHDSAGRLTMSVFSYPVFRAFCDQHNVLSGALAFAPARATVTFDGRVELAGGELVTGNYFSELDVRPLAGRSLVESDASSSSPRVLVISFNYWVREFGHSPAAVGKIININKVPYTIVGIAPAGFHGVQTGKVPDFWLPLTDTPDPEVSGMQFPNGQSLSNSTGFWWLEIIARAKPGMREEQVTSELGRIYTQNLLSAAGAELKAETLPHIYVSPGARGLETLRQRLSIPLRLLAVGMVLVLLAACFNVAVLLLARSTARYKELGVRLALGASRQRVISQLISEAVLLTAIGGFLGIGVGYWFAQVFILLISQGQVPIDLEVHLSVATIGMTLALALATGVLLGIAVALQVARKEINPLMRESSGRAFRFISGKVLIVAQLAISLIFVVAAGLFLRTLQNLEKQDIGFDKRGLLLFGLDAKQAGQTPAQVGALYSNLMQRIEALPGVSSATLARITLISNNWSAAPVVLIGDNSNPNQKLMARRNMVGPRFFRTLGIHVLMGRDIEASDTQTSPKVAAVNEAMARLIWPDRNPIGQQFTFSDYSANKEFYTVVSLVADAKYDSLRQEAPPTAYIPYTQVPRPLGLMYFEVRTPGNPAALISPIQRIVHEKAPDLPLRDVKTQAEQIDEALVQERLFAKSSSVFGILVLILTAIGTYGLSIYSVSQRIREMGIRLALGATPASVLRTVLFDTFRLVLLGGVIGLAAAFSLTKIVANMFFGVQPTDVFTMTAAFVVVLLIAILSAFPSARRASRLDPTITLRYE
jgi:predicted permease